MDFDWSQAQHGVWERMRALGDEAQVAEPSERLGVLARGGALGLALPADHGGGGLDLLTTARAYEGLGETLHDGGTLLAAGAHLFGVALVVDHAGSPAQRRAWLPRLASGEVLATVAATEVVAGSDVASARAIAERVGAGFRFTGTKRFVTSAARAGLFFAVGRDGGAGRGLTALLVPRTAAGITVGAPLATAGLAAAGLAPVDFAACEVGAEALLGRAGAGLAVFQLAMTFERALILAFRLGAMSRALDEAVRFARTREVGGGPIGRHQAVAHRVARMKLRLETARHLTYRAAWTLDRGGRGQAEAALAKWHVADAALESALDAFRVRGGAAFLEESGLPAAVDDALGGGIHSGTSDILATVVARWLGL